MLKNNVSLEQSNEALKAIATKLNRCMISELSCYSEYKVGEEAEEIWNNWENEEKTEKFYFLGWLQGALNNYIRRFSLLSALVKLEMDRVTKSSIEKMLKDILANSTPEELFEYSKGMNKASARRKK